MNLERYNYFTNDYQAYEFYSEGPKGRIRKLVIFTKIPDTDPPIYNLAFGDAHPVTGILDDGVISNNQDRDIVLATVANTIATFCDHYGNHYIYAEGSTASRTRLYQMGIAGLWEEINTDFEVYGLKGIDWREFKPYGINYDAFLVKRK
ncbi:DUF6934 family protein [Mucilaginibacter sp. FT3.2]|uniref:DUF6934 family protein n=1 Tax=Mucilaginibacter sp. FT3.2 TaxID=2723090 RepID=UPI00160E1936